MPSVKVVRPAPATNSRKQNTVKLPGSLSLVLPAHNEEENIRVVVEQALEVLPKFTSEFEIIVVNDGSRDHTAEIIVDLATNDSRVRAIHHKRNKGYGGALTTGFQATTCDFVMFMDSDRQFDINDIALLAPFVGKYDIVAGVRLERNDPFHRRLFAEVFNLTVRVLFGVHLHDIDCAFKIFRGDLLRSMELTAPGALINTEIQAKARRQGASVEQVGVHHYPRVAGEASGGSPTVIFRAMRETILLWWRMHSYVPPTSSKKPNRP
jgi:glycosyltransferase involved in cell wall biosynthesis